MKYPTHQWGRGCKRPRPDGFRSAFRITWWILHKIGTAPSILILSRSYRYFQGVSSSRLFFMFYHHLYQQPPCLMTDPRGVLLLHSCLLVLPFQKGSQKMFSLLLHWLRLFICTMLSQRFSSTSAGRLSNLLKVRSLISAR